MLPVGMFRASLEFGIVQEKEQQKVVGVCNYCIQGSLTAVIGYGRRI